MELIALYIHIFIIVPYCFQCVFLYISEFVGPGRRLLTTVNASEKSHGPEWEDCSWENDHTPGAWVVVHTLCIMIMFIGKKSSPDILFLIALAPKAFVSHEIKREGHLNRQNLN